MENSPKPGRFSAYSSALQALSQKTRTPLPSLIVSFGILHEITAVAPLVIVFYGARTFGAGDRLVKAISEDLASHTEPTNGDPMQWGRRKLSSWMDEGFSWTARVGTRYGVFGYEKRNPGEKVDIDAVNQVPGRLAGDVANAVIAFAVTKALFPLRVGISLYLSPSFSRGVVDPIRRTVVGVFRRR